MVTTRIEQAIDESEPVGDEFELSCDDLRPAWLARELNLGHDFEALWLDR